MKAALQTFRTQQAELDVEANAVPTHTIPCPPPPRGATEAGGQLLNPRSLASSHHQKCLVQRTESSKMLTLMGNRPPSTNATTDECSDLPHALSASVAPACQFVGIAKNFEQQHQLLDSLSSTGGRHSDSEHPYYYSPSSMLSIQTPARDDSLSCEFSSPKNVKTGSVDHGNSETKGNSNNCANSSYHVSTDIQSFKGRRHGKQKALFTSCLPTPPSCGTPEKEVEQAPQKKPSTAAPNPRQSRGATASNIPTHLMCVQGVEGAADVDGYASLVPVSLMSKSMVPAETAAARLRRDDVPPANDDDNIETIASSSSPNSSGSSSFSLADDDDDYDAEIQHKKDTKRGAYETPQRARRLTSPWLEGAAGDGAEVLSAMPPASPENEGHAKELCATAIPSTQDGQHQDTEKRDISRTKNTVVPNDTSSILSDFATSERADTFVSIGSPSPQMLASKVGPKPTCLETPQLLSVPPSTRRNETNLRASREFNQRNSHNVNTKRAEGLPSPVGKAVIKSMDPEEAFSDLTPLAASLLEESLQTSSGLNTGGGGLGILVPVDETNPPLFGDLQLANAVRRIHDERRDGYIRYGNTVVPAAAVERFEHSFALSMQMDEWLLMGGIGNGGEAGADVESIHGLGSRQASLALGGSKSPSISASIARGRSIMQASPTFGSMRGGGGALTGEVSNGSFFSSAAHLQHFVGGASPSPSRARYATLNTIKTGLPSPTSFPKQSTWTEEKEHDKNANTKLLSDMGAAFRSELAAMNCMGSSPRAGTLMTSAAAVKHHFTCGSSSPSPMSQRSLRANGLSPSCRAGRGILAQRKLSESMAAATGNLFPNAPPSLRDQQQNGSPIIDDTAETLLAMVASTNHTHSNVAEHTLPAACDQSQEAPNQGKKAELGGASPRIMVTGASADSRKRHSDDRSFKVQTEQETILAVVGNSKEDEEDEHCELHAVTIPSADLLGDDFLPLEEGSAGEKTQDAVGSPEVVRLTQNYQTERHFAPKRSPSPNPPTAVAQFGVDRCTSSCQNSQIPIRNVVVPSLAPRRSRSSTQKDVDGDGKFDYDNNRDQSSLAPPDINVTAPSSARGQRSLTAFEGIPTTRIVSSEEGFTPVTIQVSSPVQGSADFGGAVLRRMQSATMRPSPEGEEEAHTSARFSECFPPTPRQEGAHRVGRGREGGAARRSEGGMLGEREGAVVRVGSGLSAVRSLGATRGSSKAQATQKHTQRSRSSSRASSRVSDSSDHRRRRKEDPTNDKKQEKASAVPATTAATADPHTTYTIFQGKRMTVAERDERITLEAERIERLKRRAAEYLNYDQKAKRVLLEKVQPTARGAAVLESTAVGVEPTQSQSPPRDITTGVPSARTSAEGRIGSLAPPKQPRPGHLAPITHRPRPLSAN